MKQRRTWAPYATSTSAPLPMAADTDALATDLQSAPSTTAAHQAGCVMMADASLMTCPGRMPATVMAANSTLSVTAVSVPAAFMPKLACTGLDSRWRTRMGRPTASAHHRLGDRPLHAGQPLSLPPVGLVLPVPGHVGVVLRSAVLVDAEHVPGSGRGAVTLHITFDDRTRPRRPLVRLLHMQRPVTAAVEPLPTLGMRALPPRLTVVAGGDVVQQRGVGRVRLRALGDVGRAHVGLVSRVNLGE